MNLIYAPASPYSRKIRLCVRELALADQIDECLLSPFGKTEQDVRAINPLGKVPALQVSDTEVLFDSRVIVEYLDALSDQTSLYPAHASSAYWASQRLHALADGVLDAAVSIAFERRRPKTDQSAEWITRWTGAINRGLDALNTAAAKFDDTLCIDQIATAAIPDYLDLRLGDLVHWRNGRAALEAWFDTFSQRPSMQATKPAANT